MNLIYNHLIFCMAQQNNTILTTEILSDDWYTLKKVTYRSVRSDGNVTVQSREAYDRGDGATILLYNKDAGTVVLTRQFRLPTFINGNETGMLVETCAGLLDGAEPETCIRRETEEETGYSLSDVRKIMEVYMSPGSVTEILYFFVGAYSDAMKISDGGGLDKEQENIEVMELPFNQTMKMIETGEIKDAKTIMLLQYAYIHKLVQ